MVCTAAGIDLVAPPRRVVSYGNDVWFLEDTRLGPVVAHIAWRGDIDRLEREAAVAEHLPAGLRYPEILGQGRAIAGDRPVTYSLTRRLDGHPADRWSALRAPERRSAVAQLAEMLRILHSWSPPAILLPLLTARPGLHAGDANARDDVVALLGSDVIALPIIRAIALARHARTLPYVDAGLMAEAVAILTDLAPLDPVMDDPDRHNLIHNDIHLSNLWWTPTGVLVLLDLEWVRFGPPAVELQRLCDNADEDTRAGEDTHPMLLRWLAADYPELFSGPDLPTRMRLYSLAYALRHLAISPPDRPAADLPPGHSLHRIRRLADGSWPAPGSLPDALMPARA